MGYQGVNVSKGFKGVPLVLIVDHLGDPSLSMAVGVILMGSPMWESVCLPGQGILGCMA